jgi:ferredoxin/flavodoxin---NADP+ reductase
MLCGNPEMVKDTKAALEAKGFEKNLRRKPGQITMEHYW